MSPPRRVLEPRHFGAFRCLGADCEDTCCDGWAVTVDKPTYEKYRQHPDSAWRARFEQLIAINPAGAGDHDYARIELATTTCPFLSEGLCSIHQKLGEECLSVTCASFPRVWNVVDQVLEKSLDMGCPEAARQALLDPDPMDFQERAIAESGPNGPEFSPARVSVVNSASGVRPDKPYRHFGAVRAFVVWLLQNRAQPLWKRLLILGLFCDKLQEMAAGAGEAGIPALVQAYRDAVSAGLFEDTVNQLPARPAVLLETVAELILFRITSDFTNRKFLASYQEFMDGLEWGADSTMEQLASRYSAASAQYYTPFLSRHPHILEHYLVNYVYRGLFPFGPQESTYGLRVQNIRRSIHTEFMLMAAYFAMVQTLLVGLAGFHKESFGTEHVIRVIYTFTRTFEHSLAFPARLMQTLAEKGLDNPAGVAVLVRN